MLKIRLFLFGILAVIFLTLAFLLIYKKSSDIESGGSVTDSNSIETKPEFVIEGNPSVRTEIEQRPYPYFKSDDTMTYLSSDYSEKTPLLEISFLIRKMDGSVKPLKVRELFMKNDDWSFHYLVEGTKMRLQLGPERVHIETLGFGKEYTVVGDFPISNTTEYEYSGLTREQKFKIPSRVEQGKICQVDIVLVDEIQVHEQNLLKEAEKKSMKI